MGKEGEGEWGRKGSDAGRGGGVGKEREVGEGRKGRTGSGGGKGRRENGEREGRGEGAWWRKGRGNVVLAFVM